MVPSKCHPDKPNEAHGLCRCCYRRKRYQTEPHVRALAKRQAIRRIEQYGGRQAYSDYNHDKNLIALYGLTRKEYLQILERQNGCCAICLHSASEFKRRLAVDHDHNTGRIRGLLCIYCNTSVGQLEKIGTVNVPRMIDYLEAKVEDKNAS